MRAESGRDVQALSNSFNARFNYLYLYIMKKALLILLTLLTLTNVMYSQTEDDRIATNDVFTLYTCEQKKDKPTLDLHGKMLFYVVQKNKFEYYLGKNFEEAVSAGKLDDVSNFTITENGIILEGRKGKPVPLQFDGNGNLRGKAIGGVGMVLYKNNEKFIPPVEIQTPPPVVERVLSNNCPGFKNHAFILMDENGSPYSIHGQFSFIVIHDNNTIQLLMGSSLDKAINNGIQKEGHVKDDNEYQNLFSISWNDASDNNAGFWRWQGNGEWKREFCILDCFYLKDLGEF